MKISKAQFWGGIIFILMMILFLFLGNEIYLDKKAAQDEASLRIAYEKKIKIQELLLESFSATNELAFKLDKDEYQNNFQENAIQILARYRHIDILQLAPDAVVKYTYPLKGNEAVIGLDLLKDDVQKTEASKSIQKNHLHFVGPFKLKQGGFGVAARQPIFRDEKFWGFAAAIIKLPTLLSFAGLNESGVREYDFQLSQINPLTNIEEFYLPITKSKETGESVDVIIPEGKWVLTAIPLEHINYFLVLLPFILIGMFLSYLGAYFVYSSINRKKIADTIIKVQKNELNKVFDRITDGYVALDKNWNYVSINKRASELLGKNAKELIDKNIWTEFPEWVGSELHKALYEAMNTQLPITLQIYYEPLDLWYEDFIYPSPDGLSIYYRDITAYKKAEIGLKISEKKYRDLVEQASTSIVVYTFDGVIHEFNRASYEATGYTSEEFAKLNINDLLVGDLIVNETIHQKIVNGESTSFNREIIHKNGNILNAELTVKMMSDGKIMAIMQDITEKTVSLEKLKESESKYRSLFEQASDSIFVYSLNGKILEFNEVSLFHSGYNKAEFEKLYITDLLFIEDLKLNPIPMDKIFRGETTNTRRRIKRKNGSVMFMDISSKLMEDGNVLTFARDVTEKVEQEAELKITVERLSLAANAAKLGIWEYDINTEVFIWNDRMYEMYGFNKEKIVNTIQNWEKAIHPEDFQKLIEIRNKAIEEVSEYNLVFKLNSKDGNLKYIETFGSVILNKEDNSKRVIGINTDITERILAEKEIKLSNERYELVSKATNDAVWDWDLLTGKVYRVTEGFKKVYGFENNEEIENIEDWIEYIHPDDREQIEKILKDVHISKEQDNFLLEYKFIRPDGQCVYIIDRGFIVRNEVGKPIRMIGAAKNITESKLAEIEILKSEEKYRSLVQRASDAIVIYSQDGKILDCNEIALKITGYSRDEFLSLNVLDIMNKEDLEKNPIGFEALKEGINIIQERRFLGKDTEIFEMEVNSKMLPDGSILAIARDITERKKADFEKQQLFSLIETSQELIGFGNLDGVPTFINKAGRKLLGIAADANLADLHFSNFFHPDEVDKVATEFTPAFIENNGWEGDSYLQNINTKNKIPVYMSAYVIRDSITDKAIGLGNVSINISERKKSEQELKLLTSQLRTLTSHLENVREEERKNIAREIHDELGQQLTGLKMDIGMLAKKIGTEDKDILYRIKDIQDLSDEMVTSVKRILFHLRPSILDHFGISAAMDSYAQEFEKRHNIQTTFIASHDDLKLTPELSTELYRIFQESLTNVAKHSNAKSVTASLDSNEEGYVLAIEDDGIGFDTSIDIKAQSYGLMGMKERAFKINADFELISIPGKGTSIIISIKNNSTHHHTSYNKVDSI